MTSSRGRRKLAQVEEGVSAIMGDDDHRWRTAAWFADGSLEDWLLLQTGGREPFEDRRCQPRSVDLLGTRGAHDSVGAALGGLLADVVRRFDEVLEAVPAVREGDVAARVQSVFIADLEVRLAGVAERSLVQHSADCSRGLGDVERERYLAWLASPAGRADYFARYPVVVRLSRLHADRAVAEMAELLSRCCAIAARRGPVEAIGPAVGDRHRDGRCVRAVDFADGTRLAYKPRPLRPEAVFARMLTDLESHPQCPGFRSAVVEEHGDWGWQEWVEYRACASTSFGTYYRRLGWIAALAHGLNLNDLHYENIIAAGDHPVVVDLETLAHPTALLGDDTRGCFARTVLDTGLLPTGSLQRRGGIDLSAFCGGPEASRAYRRRSVVNEGRSDARVEYVDGPLAPSANIPFDGVGRADPAAHVDEFLAGFESGHEAVEQRLGCWLDTGHPIGHELESIATRVVLRNTSTYSKALRESTHPLLTGEEPERDLYLSHLWRDAKHVPVRRALVRSEHRDLVDDEVPVFTASFSGRDVRDSRGDITPLALRQSPRTELEQRRGRLDASDRCAQSWLAAVSAAGTTGWRPGPDVRRDRLPGEGVRDAVTWLAGTVADHAVLDEAGMPVWFEPAPPVGDRFGLRSVGDDLYRGRSGIALFLATAGLVLDDGDLVDRAARVAGSVYEGLRSLEREDDLGVWNGATGRVWCVSLVGELLGLPELVCSADETAGMIARRFAERRIDPASRTTHTYVDVVSGLAGVVLASADRCRRADVTAGWQGLLEASFSALQDSYDEPCSPRPWLFDPLSSGAGFAHGRTGVASALAVGGRLLDRASAEELARRALGLEDTTRDGAGRTWREQAEVAASDPSSGFGGTWCHGAAGIVFGRSVAGLAETADVEPALAALRRPPRPEEKSGLCHGAVGAAVMAERLRREAGEQPCGADALRATMRDRFDAGGVNGIQRDGLMCGLSGIGLGLLRLAAPSSVIDVLSLGH